jgi:predicted GNAT family acetyltransferase
MKMESKYRRLNSFDTITAEQEKVEEFRNHYGNKGQPIRLVCRKLLSQLKNSVELRDEVKGLRLATLEDLYLVVPVNAIMAQQETGINPLVVDSEKFINGCARRIIKKQVWILIENGELIFKAEIQAETLESIYLEKIYISPKEERTGLARRCFVQLCKFRLAHTSPLSRIKTPSSFIYN